MRIIQCNMRLMKICLILLFSFFITVQQSCSGSAGGVNIWDAAENENLQDINKYAKSGGDINSQAWGGETPLLLCLLKNKRKSYKRLLELGADPNIISNNGRVVVNYAAANKDSYWLKLALEHGGNPNLVNHGASKSRRGPVYEFAISLGSLENIKLLVKHKMDINQPNEDGRTPLANAAFQGKFDIVYFLLESGANYNAEPPDEDYFSFLEFMRTSELGMCPNDEMNKWLEKVHSWLKYHGVNLREKKD